MLIINIYNIKLKKRYTRDEFAKGANISPGTATKILNCKRGSFRTETIEKVARFLGCRALDILLEIPDEE